MHCAAQLLIFKSAVQCFVDQCSARVDESERYFDEKKLICNCCNTFFSCHPLYCGPLLLQSSFLLHWNRVSCVHYGEVFRGKVQGWGSQNAGCPPHAPQDKASQHLNCQHIFVSSDRNSCSYDDPEAPQLFEIFTQPTGPQ